MKYLVLFLCFLCLVVCLPVVVVRCEDGEGWLTGWNSRLSMFVECDVDDFQANFTLPVGSVYLDSVRVTDSDGLALLPVWNRTMTEIWCRFPLANVTYYLYYDNGDASAVWSVDDVFDAVVADLIVGFPMDEGSGSVMYDVSGYGNDGNLYNGAAFVAGGLFGSSCVEFDGSDDYIQVDADVSFQNFGDGLTFFYWMKPDCLSNGYDRYIFTKPINPAGLYNYFGNGGSSIRAYILDDVGYKIAVFNLDAGLAVGNWSFVCFTYAPSDYVHIYVNDTLGGISTATTSYVLNSGSKYLQISSSTNDYDGFLGFFGLVNHTVTSVERAALFECYPDMRLVEGFVVCRVWCDWDIEFGSFFDIVGLSDVYGVVLPIGLLGMGFCFMMVIVLVKSKK